MENMSNNECTWSPFLAISLLTLTQLLTAKKQAPTAGLYKQRIEFCDEKEKTKLSKGAAISLSHIRNAQGGYGIILAVSKQI